MTVRLKRVLKKWKYSSMAWNDDNFQPHEESFIILFLAQPDLPNSGRIMWNLGMWIDTAWQRLNEKTRSVVLKQIAHIMLRAKHNRAYGLWKLGETLGQHIGTEEAKSVLLQVLATAKNVEAQRSALHGLVHFTADHPKARGDIIARLERLAATNSQLGLEKDYRLTIQAIQRRKACISLKSG